MSQHPYSSQPDRHPYNFGHTSTVSPTSIITPGFPGTAAIGTWGFGQYASPSSHDQGIGEFAGGFQALLSDHGLQQALADSRVTMAHFMRERGPWSPLAVEQGLPADGVLSQKLSRFTQFRNNPPPSEAGTVNQSFAGVLSDSGYGSLPIPSVTDESIHGDGDQILDQSLLSRMQALGHGKPPVQEEPQKREPDGQRSAPGTSRGKTITCPDCHAVVKTNSELKKHKARHNRPYKCDRPGCPKAVQGFSTNNDLERHKRCVHKILTGDETVYRCNIGPCKDKDKDWPRQDNFRQHLQRKHGMNKKVDVTPFEHRLSSTDLPEQALDTGRASAPHSSWAGPRHTVSPASLMTGDFRYGQAGSMMPSPGQFSAGGSEPLSPAAAAVPQDHTPNYRVSSRSAPDMGPVLADLSIPRPPPPRASAPDMASSLSAGLAPCIPPKLLSRAGTEANLLVGAESTEVVQSGVGGDPGASGEDAHSEAGELGSTVPDAMDVDDRGQDPGEDEPDGAMESQSNLLRDAGAHHPRAEDVVIRPTRAPEALGDDASQPIDLDGESHASAYIQSLMKKGKLSEFLRKLGYSAPEDAEAKAQKPSAASSTASDNGRGYRCPECPKIFPRASDLKKHKKRHAKPYACTFPKCGKRFGSKNDWKRHESSQHFQLEVWRCTERTAGGPEQECGKVCHRRESLQYHLEKDHGICDPATLDMRLAECRMGRNFDSRFWCGFCETVVTSYKSVPVHVERFDHIDKHFNGRGVSKMDIKDWKHIDIDLPDTLDLMPEKHGRDGAMGKGRAASNKRKRDDGEPRDGGASRAKLPRDGNDMVRFWSCCDCGEYWRMRTTEKCMDGCDHTLCDDCDVF